jgi:O-antigen/teichoic acid export membrane protein
MKELVGHSLPMLMTNSMLMIAGWINTILLGIWSTESDVGIYSVVLKIATFGTFMLMSINSIATPRFAQLYAKGDMEQFRKYTAQTAKIIFLTSLPVFAGILLLNDWLLSLFGEEFKVGAMALVITMIGQSFNVFAGSVGAILNMTGHQKSFRNIITGSTIVNVIICFILIPKYGLLGSAIAGAVFMASWNLASLIYIKKKLGVDSFYNPFR